MLGQMLRRLERASLKQHDCLMLRAALTLGFFSFLWDGKFTMKNRSFNPRFYPTMQDSSWSREGVCYFVKQPKNDQMGRGATICIGCTHQCTCPVAAVEAYMGCCSCSATLHHSSTTGMGCHSQPMFFPSTFLHLIEQCSFDAAKFNTHSLCIQGADSTAARAGLLSDTIQKLVRWRSSAYETYTRHPLTHPSDTRTMAAAQ